MIGNLDDKDRVRRVPKAELLQIVSAIRSDATMQDQPICEQRWFKRVQEYLLNVHVQRFSTQVRTQLIKQGLKIAARKEEDQPLAIPTVWLCDVCKLLVDRDYEMALINLQVSQLNAVSGPKEAKYHSNPKPEDKTGLS